MSQYHDMKTYLLFLFLTAALAGGCVGPGSVKHSKIAHRAPFRSLVRQRVVLQRPMPVRASPSGMGQPYSDTTGRILPVPAAELADDCYFLGINWHRPGPAASALASDDIAWVTERSSGGRPLSRVELPAVLPKGTIIEFRDFERTRAYEAWLVPSPIGMLPYPPTITATFTAPGVSPQPDTVYEYRWGFGPHLWAAPWEPQAKPPTCL